MLNFKDFLNLNQNKPTNTITSNFDFSSEDDVIEYVNNLMDNPNSKDPFWDEMAKNLLFAIIYYLLATKSDSEVNIYSCLDVINENINEDAQSCMLSKIMTAMPSEHLATAYYKPISMLPERTFKSVFEHAKNIILENINKRKF